MAQKLGSEYHKIWEDGEIEKVVRRAQAVAVPGYRLWTFVNYALWILIIVSIAASVYLHRGGVGIIALALLALVFFLRSGEKMTTYEYAVQTIWEARIEAQHGNESRGWDLVIKAIRIIKPNIAVIRPEASKKEAA